MAFTPAIQDITSAPRQIVLLYARQVPVDMPETLAGILGLTQGGAQGFSPELACEALERGQRVVLVWASVPRVLAQAIDQTTPAGQALTIWAQDAADLLAVFRSDRRSIVMVPDDVLGDAAALRQLAKRLELPEIRTDDIAPLNVTHSQALARLAAPHFAALLQQELTASSLPVARVPASPEMFDTAAIPMQDWSRQKDLVRKIQADMRLEQENAAQAAALHSTDMTRLRQALFEASSALNVLECERDRIRQQQQDQTQKLVRLRSDMQKRLDKARREIARQRTREQAIYRSASWRVTAPLRRIGRLLARWRNQP